MVKAIKTYTASRTYKLIIQGCAKVDKKLSDNIKKSYNRYVNKNKDLISLGRNYTLKDMIYPGGRKVIKPHEMEEGTKETE